MSLNPPPPCAHTPSLLQKFEPFSDYASFKETFVSAAPEICYRRLQAVLQVRARWACWAVLCMLGALGVLGVLCMLRACVCAASWHWPREGCMLSHLHPTHPPPPSPVRSCLTPPPPPLQGVVLRCTKQTQLDGEPILKLPCL